MGQENRKKINNRLDNLNSIGTTHARTLLLRTFQEFDEEPKKVREVLKLVEVFMVRWKLAGYPAGSKLGSIFAGLCSDAFESQDELDYIRKELSDEAPDDDEFRVGIISEEFKRNEKTKYILDILETRHFGGSGYERATVDIEHIAPQGAFSADKYQTWMNALNMSEDDFNQIRNKLGNLTLLENRHNAAAGADPFEEKKQHYLGSNFEMTQEVRENDNWNQNKIEQRTKQLAQACVKIWDFDSF